MKIFLSLNGAPFAITRRYYRTQSWDLFEKRTSLLLWTILIIRTLSFIVATLPLY